MANWSVTKYGNLQLKPPSQSDADGWDVWAEKVELRIKALKKQTHSKQREEWRRRSQKNRAWIQERVKMGRWKQIFNRVRGENRAEIDRDCLVVFRDGERVLIHDPEEVAAELTRYFAEWMGEDADNWFEGPGAGFNKMIQPGPGA